MSRPPCSPARPTPWWGPQPAQTLTRPAFKMPFLCGQTWLGNNWNGHSPAHSIDWNHYDANGNPDDYGRRVVATSKGYGHVIVIGHGDGWTARRSWPRSTPMDASSPPQNTRPVPPGTLPIPREC